MVSDPKANVTCAEERWHKHKFLNNNEMKWTNLKNEKCVQNTFGKWVHVKVRKIPMNTFPLGHDRQKGNILKIWWQPSK